MTEPVTLEEAKVAARIDADDTGFDEYIDGAIVAARKQAEHITRRFYVEQSVDVALRDWPTANDVLQVNGASSCAVSYWDGAAWVALDADAYSCEPYKTGTLLWTSSTWPPLGDKPGDRVRLTFSVGQDGAAAPESVKLYIMANVAGWVNNPDAAQRQALTPNPLYERMLDQERLWG